MPRVKSYVLLLFYGLKDLALGKPLRLCLVISEFVFWCRQAKYTALFLAFLCTTMKEGFQWNMWYLLMCHLAMLCILGTVICSFHLLDNAEGEPWFLSQGSHLKSGCCSALQVDISFAISCYLWSLLALLLDDLLTLGTKISCDLDLAVKVNERNSQFAVFYSIKTKFFVNAYCNVT